jgi:D-amino-acid dehydrogenase
MAASSGTSFPRRRRVVKPAAVADAVRAWPNDRMRIIVIGAGIVGLTTAWWLARDGHVVTVLDRAGSAGQGASFANGAQLSYAYVAPLAAPSVLRSLPKWLLSGDSPVRVRLAADPAQWAWLLAFLRACTAAASDAATAKLVALAILSRASLHEMLEATPVAFCHRRNGKLVVQSSAAGMAEAQRQMRLQAAFGCRQEALGRGACLALEPSLAAIGDRLVGGILTPDEEVGDCRLLCEGLHAALAAPPFGVRFLLGTEVLRLVPAGGRLNALRTSAGDLDADAFVLAAGAQAARLARAAGVRLAVQPVRGYSITAPLRPGNRAPVRSITDAARKVVYAPLGDTMRVAGFAEIGGDGERTHQDRVAALARELATTFPGVCEPGEAAGWSGLRPATPTSLPLIGATRVRNLFVNAGQGALGFTLAAGSARLLADIVAGRTPPLPAADYAVR